MSKRNNNLNSILKSIKSYDYYSKKLKKVVSVCKHKRKYYIKDNNSWKSIDPVKHGLIGVDEATKLNWLKPKNDPQKYRKLELSYEDKNVTRIEGTRINQIGKKYNLGDINTAFLEEKILWKGEGELKFVLASDPYSEITFFPDFRNDKVRFIVTKNDFPVEMKEQFLPRKKRDALISAIIRSLLDESLIPEQVIKKKQRIKKKKIIKRLNTIEGRKKLFDKSIKKKGGIMNEHEKNYLYLYEKEVDELKKELENNE